MRVLSGPNCAQLLSEVNTFQDWPAEFAKRPLTEANLSQTDAPETVKAGGEYVINGMFSIADSDAAIFTSHHPYAEDGSWAQSQLFRLEAAGAGSGDGFNQLAGLVANVRVGVDEVDSFGPRTMNFGKLLGIEAIEQPYMHRPRLLHRLLFSSVRPGAARLLGAEYPGGLLRGEITRLDKDIIGEPKVREMHVRTANDSETLVYGRSLEHLSWTTTEGQGRAREEGDQVSVRVIGTTEGSVKMDPLHRTLEKTPLLHPKTASVAKMQ